MQFLDNIIILGLIIGAFFMGKHISDAYNYERIKELEYQLRLMAAEKGVGFVAPPQKLRRAPIGQPFMDRLKETGKAIQQLDKS